MNTSHRIAILSILLCSSPLHGQNSDRPTRSDVVNPSRQVSNWLANHDTNEDGRIAKDEAKGLMKSNFDRVDANADGSITEQELTALAERLGRNSNNNRRRRRVPSDDEILKRVPHGVKVDLDIPYRDGNDSWKLDLAMPSEPSNDTRPAIVFVHGGGWTSGDKRTALFLDQAISFAEKGYVCVTVNYRLDASKLPCVEDVKCAVRWLRAHAKKYNVDQDRIGAYGNSAGAHLVVMLGISDQESRLEGDGPWRDQSSAVQAVVASATPTSPRIRGESDFDVSLVQPMNYVRSNVPPMLLFHEASDRTVPVSNSDDFVAALRKAGAENIQYERYTDGSGHGVFQRNLAKTAPQMAAFFDRTLAK